MIEMMRMDESRYHMLDYRGQEVDFTDAQKKCIDYSSKTALVIKGTAGSGKTFMVAARAKDYLKQIEEEGSGKKVAIFVYTKSLEQMLKELLKRNGINTNSERIQIMTADRYLGFLCKAYGIIPKASMASSYGYGRPGNYRTGRSGYSNSFVKVGDEERVTIVGAVMKELSYSDSSPVYKRDPKFVADEIRWMYQNGIVDEDDENRYLEMSREGRCKKYSVHLSKEARKKVFRIFVGYNNTLWEKKKFEWDRLYALLYRNKETSMEDSYKFDYVLIDEAQDLSLTQMRLLTLLCRDELSIAMDKNQSLYGHRWSFQRDVGIRPHVKNLKIQFRNTMEIDLLSQDLKKTDDSLLESEDIYEVEISGTEGELPRVVHCRSDNSEVEFIADLVQKLYGKSTTAILCLDYDHLNMYNKRLRACVPDVQLFKADDDFSPFTPGVKLMTLYSAKGLGFTNVIIPNFEDGVYPKSAEAIANELMKRKAKGEDPDVSIDEAFEEEVSDSRRLVYVGITRAMTRLYLTYSGKPSPFLSEFDTAHYELVDESLKPTSDPRIGTYVPPHAVEFVPDSHRLEMFDRNNVPKASEESKEQDHGVKMQDRSSRAKAQNSPDEANDPIIVLLQGFEVYDRRPMNGALWVIDGPGVIDRLKRLNEYGYEFHYSKNGSRSTGHRPAYYMK